MSDDHIPPGVRDEDAALLRRAYELTSVDEGQELYGEWAETYESTMLDGLGYVSPTLAAECFAEHVVWRDRPVLDVGCGTGLVGTRLSDAGFRLIDGLDLSTAMMAEARRTAKYRHFIEADLHETLPIESASYGAVICVGTFTSGHVDASCLDELLRILRPAGMLLCTVHHAVWEVAGFQRAFEHYTETGALVPLVMHPIPFYASNQETDGMLCAFSLG